MWASVFAVGVILYACGTAMFGCVLVRRVRREGGDAGGAPAVPTV
jgi:hypothetical protein